ncbi:MULTISPECIES: fibronectin type III domain-containing protein [Clostridium]|uniref:Purple acid phosphatase N-terminal domain-containing protein n=2 Tax=Clostridium TaxID=1485 RepID=A0A166SV05_9CLOT|nr:MULTISPECIES: fibronectin type III domain-containing protein [Clostridium]AGY76902.1 fibronectin type III domain-containing protein [Clostridium autoethanogenum DSM 10061]ALU37048.1 Hypothetical protein CLAU_2620 [Clostridium autoethanogenum DSM 10061]OAA92804.1 hypothetical protein WX73_00688 [Clostridium coskatii]OBR92151.1 hypothetical protein CLCOS_31460 [Clostridium coskatii]OVY48744.1 hypothetical protein WX72_00384 [Clostridium autoethanogenum]
MKKKYLSMIIAALIAATSTIAPIYSVHAAYDNTTINTNLNSTVKPDHITLTWTKDPKTTQTITWRTSTNVTKGLVQYKNLTTGETKTFNATKQDFSTSSTDINTGCINLLFLGILKVEMLMFQIMLLGIRLFKMPILKIKMQIS